METGFHLSGIREDPAEDQSKFRMTRPLDPMKQLLITGLQHDDYFVRSESISLLSDDLDAGIEATHAAISAIERHGWEDAYEFSHMITRLPLDGEAVERTVAWILEDHTAPPYGMSPRKHLLFWLAKGPVELFPRWTEPLGIDLEKDRESFGETPSFRAALRSKSAGECLDLLDQMLHDCAGAGDIFPHGPINKINWLCERLAEFDLPRDREIVEWLESGLGNFRAGAALIASRHRGRLAVPVATVLRLFDFDWDWLNEEIAKCLIRTAGREEILEILRLFPDLSWHARLFVCSVLEENRHPGIEGEIARVAADEPSSELPYRFTFILAAYGTPETREIARNMLASLPPSPEKGPTHGTLYLWCRLLDEEWEELAEWRAELEKGDALLKDQLVMLQAMDFQLSSMTPEELMQHLAATPPYRFPREVLNEMVARLDEMRPALLAELERFVAAPESFDGDSTDWMTLTFAAYLLAQARETRAFKPLVALLSQSHYHVRLLWDEMIADCSMGCILASVYDGDEAVLRGLIENPGIEESVRGTTAIHCLETLVLVGRISRDDLETYYGELLESKLEKSPALVWDAVSASIGNFGFVRLLPAVEKAFAEGICDPAYSCFEDIATSAKLAGFSDNFSGSGLHLIDDVITETESWACFDPDYDHENQDAECSESEPWEIPEYFSDQPLTAYRPPVLVSPHVRESPKIGRNDPCPCGSGKKYKKCCG